MKRMIAFIFVILSMFSIFFFKDKFTFKNDFERMVIISQSNNLNLQAEAIQNGNDFYYFLDNGTKLKNINDREIKGIVLYYSKKYNLNYFNKKFDFTLTKESKVEGRSVYYGYDKDYQDFRFINNKKINVQLVFNGNEWIMGYPMILTGF